MPEIELGCKLSHRLHLCLYIQEPWSHVAWKVICTYSPLNNFQQGLICISDSETTSIQVIPTLLHVLQQCTSKHFTNVGKCNCFHITKNRGKYLLGCALNPSQGNGQNSGPRVPKVEHRAVKLPSCWMKVLSQLFWAEGLELGAESRC